AELLGSVGGAAAVTALCRLLSDRSAEVRVVAARSLGRVADPGAAAPLLEAMQSGRPVPPMVVAQSLLRLGPAAAPTLTGALTSSNAATRMVSAQILGLLGAAAAAPALTRLVADDPDPLARLSAVRALGRIGMPSGAGVLTAATAPHEDDALRAAAAAALGELGPQSVPVLAGLLADPVHQVAHNAAGALCGLGETGLAALRLNALGAYGGSTQAHAAEALALAVLRDPALRSAVLPEPVAA
ncbi:MAG: HEAT repeat domain-containing protein, partial [Actinomycetota bacterium]|nr:HEAT repeat domain-containing protein [Actinomycetota bacterium]